MEKEIKELISLQTEGGYWDYKEKWHSNKSDLLHDIICMANNIEDRDAYIIIGVDNNGEITGVENDENRKRQQDLIDFLRGVKFAGDKRPNVLVKTLSVREKEIDVIVIKNTTDTPYYLTVDFSDKDGKKTVHKGNIYTRIGDTNTPRPQTADIDKTEHFWKKRFGLTQPVFSLAKLLLNDEPENWEYRYDETLSTTIYHHKIRPEFTVEIIDILHDENRIDKPNFWFFYLYNAIGVVSHPKIWFRSLYIKYQTTVLYEAEIISCDEGNFTTAYFNNETFYKIRYEGGLNNGLVVAYLILDSDEACIHNFINGQLMMNDKSVCDKRDVDGVILFFDSEQEKTDFFDMVNSKSSEFIEALKPSIPPTALPRDNRDAYDIAMSLRGSKILKEWLQIWKLHQQYGDTEEQTTTSYVTYWPANWVKTILKNGDNGPLSVIYGGEHRSQPPLGKVSVGDVVFPVTLMQGQLYVLGRMTISEILQADDYTTNTLHIKREPFMWDSYTQEHQDSITHIIPRTCADDAAIGTDGTPIALRPVPTEIIPLLKLGPKPGQEQPLKMRGDKISINNFSGYFRRLSDTAAKMLDGVIIKSSYQALGEQI